MHCNISFLPSSIEVIRNFINVKLPNVIRWYCWNAICSHVSNLFHMVQLCYIQITNCKKFTMLVYFHCSSIFISGKNAIKWSHYKEPIHHTIIILYLFWVRDFFDQWSLLFNRHTGLLQQESKFHCSIYSFLIEEIVESLYLQSLLTRYFCLVVSLSQNL